MSSNSDEYIIDNKYLRVSTAATGFTLLGAFFLWLSWSIFLNQWLGSTTVGSPWAKNNFETQYWVYLQPDNADAKNYRVKADISRYDGIYSLSSVYWPNGGYLTFDDCKIESKDGTYVSEDACGSSSNDGEDSVYYDVRLDTKVPPQQKKGQK